LLKFGTVFDHLTAEVLHKYEVKGSKVGSQHELTTA